MAERNRYDHVAVAVLNIGTCSTTCTVTICGDPEKYCGTFIKPFPTRVLFDKEKKFLSFGNEAEDQYATICNDENKTDFYFFRGFKLELFNSFINGELTIKDVMGKSMSSVDVLSACIEYLRVRIMKLNPINLSKENECGFVLTVPEVLRNPCKPFMVEAARKAGIQEDDFLIISEPEAACIWCHHLYKNVLKFERLDVPLQTKTDILVVDTGSEVTFEPIFRVIVDITVNIIPKDNNPEELSQNRSWNFGRNPVDKVFRDFLSDVFGSDVMDEFKDKDIEEYNDLFHLFYVKLHIFRENENNNVLLKMPGGLIKLFEKKRGISFKYFIKPNSSLKYMTSGVLRVLGAAGTSLIKLTFEKIVDSLNHVLKKSHMTDVATIIMFGWLSESPIMQTLIRESFPDKRIIFPEDTVNVVMTGALIFGQGISTTKPKLFSEK